MNKTQITALINTLEDNGLNTAAEVRTILNAFRDSVFMIGEIKEVKQSDAFIAANYDVTGLGILEMTGFAKSNGNNGTVDKRRRVSVGQDETPYVSGFDYSVLGNTFGEEKHQLTVPEMPSHHHSEVRNVAGSGAGGSGTFDFGAADTSNTGGDQAHNNMQPSIVSLFIQRIA